MFNEYHNHSVRILVYGEMIMCNILVIGIVFKFLSSGLIKGQVLFLVKVKGQWPFYILTALNTHCCSAMKCEWLLICTATLIGTVEPT